MRVCAIIPAYNEASRIGGVVEATRPYVDHVIVIDDGSTDGTGDIARCTGAQVIVHPENCGAGAATMTGLLAARHLGFDVALTIDADGQHNPEDIPTFLSVLVDQKADLVIANRFGQRNKIPFVRRLFNGFGNLLTFLVTGLFLPDTQSGFKVFGSRALQEIELRMAGFEFCTEIIGEASRHHWKVVSVPTKVVYSPYTLAKGQSFANGLITACKILLRCLLR